MTAPQLAVLDQLAGAVSLTARTIAYERDVPPRVALLTLDALIRRGHVSVVELLGERFAITAKGRRRLAREAVS